MEGEPGNEATVHVHVHMYIHSVKAKTLDVQSSQSFSKESSLIMWDLHMLFEPTNSVLLHDCIHVCICICTH